MPFRGQNLWEGTSLYILKDISIRISSYRVSIKNLGERVEYMKNLTFRTKVAISISVFTVSTLIALFSMNRLAFANSCDRTYGGGLDCERGMDIEKTVIVGDYRDKSGDFKKSVNVSKGDQVVTFKIVVKNTGDTDIKNVIYSDSLPSEFEFIDGTLREDIGTLDNGDQNGKRTFYILARVKNSEFVKGIAKCVVNTAKIKYTLNGDKEKKSSASVCYGITGLPKTGPADTAALVLTGISMIGLGFSLKRYSK